MNNVIFIFRLVYDLFIAFKAETCLQPSKWLVAMLVRGATFTLFCLHQDQFFTCFQMDRGETMGALCYDLFLILPLCLFLLWYFFTTLLMFLGVLYFKPASNNNRVKPSYPEIQRLLEWRENKMRFVTYQDATQLMRDTAIINNLDPVNPEARKMHDYINNKLQFMSYSEGCEFLRGNKS